jgi:hypothetical protein
MSVMTTARGAAGLLIVMASTLPVRAEKPEMPTGAPAPEPTLRITPENVRALAKMFTHEVLEPHYNLDAATSGQVTEAIARRVMAAAHAADQKSAADSADYIIAEAIHGEIDGTMRDGPSPELLKHGSELVLPYVPLMRQLVAGVGSDLQSILPRDQQLRLLGDMALAGTAINAFEQNVQRWASGDTSLNPPFESPKPEEPVSNEADGQSKWLREARESTRNVVRAERWTKGWGDYVEQAKRFYELDPSQCATADSLLREYSERLEAMNQDAQWRDGMIRSFLWLRLSWEGKQKGVSLLGFLAFTRVMALRKEPEQLGYEFKRRIDEIPTVAQRRSADDRMTALLAAKGFAADTEPGP